MTQIVDPILSNKGNTLIITAGKDFDSVAVSKIRPQLMRVLEEGELNVAFDFSMTEFIDSSGMGLCVFCSKRLQPKGMRVGIVGLKGQPKSVIGLSQIDKTVPVSENIEAFMGGTP